MAKYGINYLTIWAHCFLPTFIIYSQNCAQLFNSSCIAKRTRIKQKEAECQIQPHLKRHVQGKITPLSFLAICGQSYKHFTIVNYDSRVRLATDWLEQNSLKRA